VGFMNARRLILIVVASLLAIASSASLAAPVVLAEELCPNAASRQGPSAALPDCRAYEQVTPADKGDAQDLFPSSGLEKSTSATENNGYAAEDGNRFLLFAESSFAGGNSNHSSYVFTRGATGWTTQSLSPGPGVHGIEAKVFNSNLTEVGVEDLQYPHLAGQEETPIDADYVGPVGGPYTTVSSLSYREAAGDETLAGASADMSRVIIQTKDRALAPGAGGQDEGSNALYESFEGQLRLVNVTSNGSLLNPCGAQLGQGGPRAFLEPAGLTHNAVSSDGSEVFFTAPDPDREQDGAGCWNATTSPQENPPELYMRLDGTSTVEISAPNTGVHDPDGPQPAVYVGASADGSKVFFVTKAELTADDTGHALELYEYDTEAPEGERLVRVSSGESGTAEGNIDFVGAVSSDGLAVYFAAFGDLAQGASPLAEASGYANLYRYDTQTRKTTYIAQTLEHGYPLNPGQSEGWYDNILPRTAEADRPEFLGLNADAEWYTTSNGQYLVFGSSLPLTGYDNAGSCENLYAGGSSPLWDGKCAELFRYSAADNSIVCVSCAGGPPVDNARFNRSPFEVLSAAPPRPISEDGSYVFFETLNALVPQTTDKSLHVYEWHDGKISLISSADDPANAYFVGASADGSNVFFGTHAQLVPGDTDIAGDLYDARIDGGFVGVTPALCTGTGCQGIPAAPPIFATPASVTFEGVGNFPPTTGAAATVKPKAKTPTRAQKLSQALKVCKQKRSASKRAHCQAQARKHYGAAHRPTKSNRRGK
jgi:hypothetical protein